MSENREMTITDHDSIPGKVKLSAEAATNIDSLLVTHAELVSLYEVLGAYLDKPDAQQVWFEGAQAASDWIKGGAWVAVMPENPYSNSEVQAQGTPDLPTTEGVKP